MIVRNVLRGREDEKARELLESVYIDVEDLIDELRFEYQHSSGYFTNPNAFNKTNDTGDWVMCCCPNHAENRPSFGISKDPPYHCNCFYCGYLGTVDKVIEIALGLDDGEGLSMLLSTYLVDEKRMPIDVEAIIDSGREPLRLPALDETILQGYLNSRERNPWVYDTAMAYMVKERGLSQKTLQTYEIGVDVDNRCITFPQRTRKGELRFIQKRKIGNNFHGARFINDGSPVKKDILFGLHFIDKYKTTKDRIRRVRICEAPIDAMSNYEVGIAAVALNGRILFKNQVEALQLAGVEVVDLMLDNDEAGQQGTEEAVKKLVQAGMVVNVVRYANPLCKDANDLLRCGLLDRCEAINVSLLNGFGS